MFSRSEKNWYSPVCYTASNERLQCKFCNDRRRNGCCSLWHGWVCKTWHGQDLLFPRGTKTISGWRCNVLLHFECINNIILIFLVNEIISAWQAAERERFHGRQAERQKTKKKKNTNTKPTMILCVQLLSAVHEGRQCTREEKNIVESKKRENERIGQTKQEMERATLWDREWTLDFNSDTYGCWCQSIVVNVADAT